MQDKSVQNMLEKLYAPLHPSVKQKATGMLRQDLTAAMAVGLIDIRDRFSFGAPPGLIRSIGAAAFLLSELDSRISAERPQRLPHVRPDLADCVITQDFDAVEHLKKGIRTMEKQRDQARLEKSRVESELGREKAIRADIERNFKLLERQCQELENAPPKTTIVDTYPQLVAARDDWKRQAEHYEKENIELRKHITEERDRQMGERVISGRVIVTPVGHSGMIPVCMRDGSYEWMPLKNFEKMRSE